MNFDNSNNILFGSHSSNKRLAADPDPNSLTPEEIAAIREENKKAKEPEAKEKGKVTYSPNDNSGVGSVNKMLLELAAKKGQLAQFAGADLQKRDVLISRLLTLTSEDNVIRIITKGLTEYAIPFEDFIDICDKAINATYKSGEDIDKVLNFALYHYRKIQNHGHLVKMIF